MIALRAFDAGLGGLAGPGDGELSVVAFAEELREALGVLTVPAHPGRGGVELHTPLSLYGARVPHIFVLGAAEGALPAPVREDPVLDFREREQLAAAGARLETAAGAASRETLPFWALLHAEPEEAEETLAASLQGQFTHDVLKRAAGLAGAAGPEAMDEQLEAAFVEAEERFGLERLPAWPARRREVLDRLRRAVRSPEFAR